MNAGTNAAAPVPAKGAILVTGAAGLVGHAIRCRLEAAGRRVVALDRQDGVVEGRPVVGCDLTDAPGLKALVRQADLGGIVHCGAVSGPDVLADQPALIAAVNVTGTVNVLELAREARGVRMVFCSSTSAVGPTPPGLSPVPEDVPLNPSTVYGASKAAGESLVAGYSRQFGIDGVSLRLGWIYGPRRTTPCTLRRLLQDALAGRETRIDAGAGLPRPYLYVDDAADALVAALDRPHLPRRTYTITGGWWGNLHDVAEVLSRVVPKAQIALGNAPAPGEDWQAPFDLSAAVADLGYRACSSLEEGLRSYRDWLASNQPRDETPLP